MSFIEGIKDFFLPDDTEGDTPISPAASTATVKEETTSRSASTSSYTPSYAAREEQPERRRNDKYSSIRSTAQFQVVLVMGTKFSEDAQKVADYLLQSRTVVLNLEHCDDVSKRRIVDFVVGATYALHGNIKAIGNDTFLIMPQNVGFDGGDKKVMDQLQSNGLA